MAANPPSDLTVRQQRLFDKCMEVKPGDEESAWRAIAAGARASNADIDVVLRALRASWHQNGPRRS